jgi:hypothetical protein
VGGVAESTGEETGLRMQRFEGCCREGDVELAGRRKVTCGKEKYSNQDHNNLCL